MQFQAKGQQRHHAEILDGRKLAKTIKKSVQESVKPLNPKPGIAALLIGDNPASSLYISLKKRACENANITFHDYTFEADVQEKTIIEVISFLNSDPDINGILVQLPLPEHLDTDAIIAAISPAKDVDGFHAETIATIQAGKPTVLSPLALGIDALIRSTKEPLHNKIVTVFANHEIFAEPFKYLYGKENKVFFTTPNDPLAQEKCHNADVLIVAIGNPKFVNNKYIKKDAIVIDVGINDLGDETVGDVDFEEVSLKAKYISPVPGGVGPMTVAYLIENVVKLYNQQKNT